MKTIEHLISSYEVLPDGGIKPSAMLKIMQDVATNDASCLGADYVSMREKDMIFVITKIIVEFTRQPHVDERISVRTWNPGTAGVSFIRNYEISVGDEIVGRATSRWVLVSYETRRILRPDALVANVNTNNDEMVNLELTRRIKLADGAEVINNTYNACLTDMDTNYHVNNTRYGDFLVDYCGIDFKGKNIDSFEIHFSSELKGGDSVDIAATAQNSVGNMIATKNGTQVFSASIAVSDN